MKKHHLQNGWYLQEMSDAMDFYKLFAPVNNGADHVFLTVIQLGGAWLEQLISDLGTPVTNPIERTPMTNPTPATERINLPNGCLLHKHGDNWHLSVPTGNFDGMIEEFDDVAAKAFAAAMNAHTDEVRQLRAQLADRDVQLAAMRATLVSIYALIPTHDYLCYGTSEAAMRGFLMLITHKCQAILEATRQPTQDKG